MKCLWPWHTFLPILIVIFRKYIYIFGEILTLLGNFMCFRGFSAKTVLRIVILKSGIFRGFFQCGLEALRGTKNPPDGKYPRISKMKGFLTFLKHLNTKMSID
jgi:hypothetical protein